MDNLIPFVHERVELSSSTLLLELNLRALFHASIICRCILSSSPLFFRGETVYTKTVSLQARLLVVIIHKSAIKHPYI